MRFFILMSVFGILSVVLETTWLSHFPAASLRLDFILISIAALAFSFKWRDCLPVIVFFGIIMDVTSGAPLGMSIFSYVIVYGFIRAIVAKISFQVGPALFFWIACVSLVDKFVCSLVLMASTGEMTIPKILMRRALPQALVDSICGLGLVPFLRWYWDLSWEKITRPKGLVLK